MHRGLRRLSVAKTLFCDQCSAQRTIVNFQKHRNNGHAIKGSSQLLDIYQNTKAMVEGNALPANRNPMSVFANNELALKDIDVYGFDYDYTLASYKDSLHSLIYNLARDDIIQHLRYPKEIVDLPYNPEFAIRGLHCDLQHGLTLKIDAFLNIQLGTVYRGMNPVPNEEVLEIYNGSHVSSERMSTYYRTGNMHQIVDLFALPEICLFSHIVEYFTQNNIAFDPEYVFHDVHNTVQNLHISGKLHGLIMGDIEKYLDKGKGVSELLNRLSGKGKQLFLITNSGPHFVNKGMTYMFGEDWHELFDVIITNARKPKFYSSHRPFREFDINSGLRTWDKVTHFKKGKFYEEGNFYHMHEMTGWNGARVLYFGDHVYSDLADATLRHGWRTGAIIPELEKEIGIMNSDHYKKSVQWLIALEELMEEMQEKHDGKVFTDAESREIIAQWTKEREELRHLTKNIFNPQFGSIFRTFHNPTYYTRRLNKLADVYTSSPHNLLNYSIDHTFYPRRPALPHEAIFDYPDVPSLFKSIAEE